MNTKSLLVCLVTIALTMCVATAAMHGGGGGGGSRGGHFAGAHAGFAHPGAGAFHGNHWGGDWHHGHGHGHGHDDFIFIGGGFGWPYWGWGWGYPYYGYPYPYYPYGYPYGYYGSGYYGYGGGYYGGGGYASHTSVVNLQRQLAHAGYYHGHIDGVMGPRTRSAMRAYQRDHATANNGPVRGRPVYSE